MNNQAYEVKPEEYPTQVIEYQINSEEQTIELLRKDLINCENHAAMNRREIQKINKYIEHLKAAKRRLEIFDEQ